MGNAKIVEIVVDNSQQIIYTLFTMKIKEQNRKALTSHFEFRWKNSDKGKLIIERINNNESFTPEELKSITNKLEYKFKNSDAGKTLVTEILG